VEREQILEFGDIRLRKTNDRSLEVLFFLSGKKLYEIASQSGDYPPLGWRRPGFLVGKRLAETGEEERPPAAAHLLQEMGGVWAHPIKGIENLYFSVSTEERTWMLRDSDKFVNHLAYADLYFKLDDIQVVRRDFVVEDVPAFFNLVRIVNRGKHSRNLKLNLTVTVNTIPSWFSGWPRGEDKLFYDNGRVVAYDSLWTNRWGLVFGTIERPESHQFGKYGLLATCTLTYRVDLDAGQEREFPFLYVIEHERGYPQAIQVFDTIIGKSKELLDDKVAYYDGQVFDGVKFGCSDQWFTEAFYLAKANLVMLTAEPSPYLGRYLFAGVPEYVQFFGTDTAYSIPGLMAAGYGELAREALMGLAQFGRQHCGRIPHEVTTNGRIFHPGNTQETPQFAIAAWNYFKWSGDRVFLEDVYPICQEGVLSYVPAHWDLDLDYYPDGNAMVERLGMGSEKLDSICYFCEAIYCLAEMAGVLHRPQEREAHLNLADSLREAINADWWMEDQELYADSLKDDHAPQLDGHWTVAVPMETRLAPWDRAIRSLDKIEKEWVNEWGMVHTRVKEEFVWTLPTGVLATAEFNYGRPEMGIRLTRDISETLKYGTLGSYKELIPEGLSFFQLWSPAMFLKGAVEGVFGLECRADEDRLNIFPRLSKDWTYANIEGLTMGIGADQHKVGIFCEQVNGESVRVVYQAGHGRLRFTLRLAIEGQPKVRSNNRNTFRYEFGEHFGQRVIRTDFELEPRQCARVVHRDGQVILELCEPLAETG